MPYSATVFHVLIASPSDVLAEREEIAKSLHTWNALHAKTEGKVLLPVMWESHSAPSMAGRPQSVINDQMVKDCDMLIGAFWKRLGTPTGVEASGTVEEVREFLKLKKPVMLYFSKVPGDLDTLDTKQLEALKAFKADIKGKGLVGEYESAAELGNKLIAQLTIVMREISVGTSVDQRAVKRAIETAGNQQADNASLPDSEASALGVFLEFNTAKSFIIRGDVSRFKPELEKLNGSWTKLAGGGAAWCFSNKRLREVAKLLKIEPTLKSA